MKYVKIREGKISLYVPNPKKYKLDSKMPVFFNPVMKLNRDISIILLNTVFGRSSEGAGDTTLARKVDKEGKAPYGGTGPSCLDLLAGTGARGLRIVAEVPNSRVALNDANPNAIKLIRRNAKLNDLNVEVSHNSANRFLKESKRKWDYIDLDPFGTPKPFLEMSVSRLSKRGIISVTATDTSALCGAYPHASVRKYNSRSLRCPIMHELGIRILINAVQDVAWEQNVHLKPIFSHSSDHYMRIYLQRVAKKQVKKGYIKYNFRTGKFSATKTKPRNDYAGPLWLGSLWDIKLVRKMVMDTSLPILETILVESKIKTVGFYDIHALAKIYKLEQLPKLDKIITGLRKKGFKAERTHFTHTGIRTNAKLKDLKVLLN